MSLLGTQVYANPDTPCWVSANGDTINGNLTVTGSIEAFGAIKSTDSLQSIDGTGAAIVRISDSGGNGFIQTPTLLNFTRIGAGTGNTSLTISAAGANTDVMAVGGKVQARELALLGADGTPSAAAVCGLGSVPTGSTTTPISTTAVKASSKIFLSHRSGVPLGVLSYDPINITPGVSFVVELTDATTGAPLVAPPGSVSFTWLIIN